MLYSVIILLVKYGTKVKIFSVRYSGYKIYWHATVFILTLTLTN